MTPAPININDLPDALAAEILRDACVMFPGLVDGEEEVNGGDLVEYLTTCVVVALDMEAEERGDKSGGSLLPEDGGTE